MFKTTGVQNGINRIIGMNRISRETLDPKVSNPGAQNRINRINRINGMNRINRETLEPKV